MWLNLGIFKLEVITEHKEKKQYWFKLTTMKAIRFIFLISILYFLSGCENENTVIPDDTEETDTPEPIEYAEQIMIEQTSDVMIQTFDHTLGNQFENNNEIFDIDVDKDSIMDFRVRMYDYWPNINPFSYFSCLHEGSKVLGFLENDSVFYFQYNDVGREFTTYNCYKTIHHDSSSSLYSVTEDPKLGTIYPNEILHKNDSFITDTITIAGQNSIEYFSSSMDRVTWDLTCDDLPAGEITYIGIKIIKEGKERLGWIKISFSEDKMNLTVLESGIQFQQ